VGVEGYPGEDREVRYRGRSGVVCRGIGLELGRVGYIRWLRGGGWKFRKQAEMEQSRTVLYTTSEYIIVCRPSV